MGGEKVLSLAVLTLFVGVLACCGDPSAGGGGKTSEDRAAACLDGGDASAALFRKALEADPGYTPARLDLARLLTNQGRCVEAIRLLEEGKKDDPGNAPILFQIGRTYLAAAEVEGALKAVNEGLALAPASAEGLLLLGKLSFEFTRNRKEGLVAMRRALELDPAVPGGRRQLAGALTIAALELENKGEADGAFELVEEALGFAPDLAAALLARGRMLIEAGRFDEGLAELRKVRAGHGDNDEVKDLLAGTLKRMGYRSLRLRKRSEALAYFREAVALKAPGVDVAVIERILAEEERPESKDTRVLDEQQARTFFERGSVALHEGRAAEAMELFRKSLELLPVNPFARHHLGLAYLVRGNVGAGEKELERAVREAEELEVDLPAAYVKLAEIALGRNRHAAAREWLDRHDRLYPERADDKQVKALRALL